jgi:hypothetical protein
MLELVPDFSGPSPPPTVRDSFLDPTQTIGQSDW